MVDATDSKSVEGNLVWVRVPPPVPASFTRKLGPWEVFLLGLPVYSLCQELEGLSGALVHAVKVS